MSASAAPLHTGRVTEIHAKQGLPGWIARMGTAPAAAILGAAASVATGICPWSVAIALVSTILVLLSCSILPRYERLRSRRPAAVLIMVIVIALAIAPFLGVPSLDRIALALVAASAALGSLAQALIVSRKQIRSAVVVGEASQVRQLIGRLGKSVNVTAVCLTDQAALATSEGLPDAETIGLDTVRAANLAQATRADQVIAIPGPILDGSALRRLSWQLEQTGSELVVVSDVAGVAPHRVKTRVAGGLINISVSPGAGAWVINLAKDIIDRVGGALLLIVFALPMLALAIAVKVGSPGPAFFTQRRVGRDGKEFTMVKFRSMVVDAEARLAELQELNEGAGPLFKLRNDPRITGVGRLMRRTSLDELPQLINVVRGEMSLIGPRPALPTEVAQYESDTTRRLRVKPGMTGLWQVSGRSDLEWEEAVNLDLYYVDNLTLTGDFKIAWRTVKAVTTADGAT